MTPVFHRKNKTLIMLPNKWIRIKHIPQQKIEQAKQLVYSAFDQILPFAYRTIKPQYYLEPSDKDGNTVDSANQLRYKVTHLEPFRADGKYLPTDIIHRCYTKRKIVDMHTKNLMTNNFYKLRRALRLLHKEGYVHSYTLRSDRLKLKVRWECDVKYEPIKIDLIDYGCFMDYKPEPHRPRFKIWRQGKVREREEERAILAMRKAFPLGNIKQGMLDKEYEGPAYQVTADDPGFIDNSAWSPRDMINHGMRDDSFVEQNKYLYTDEYQEKLLLSWMIAKLHWEK